MSQKKREGAASRLRRPLIHSTLHRPKVNKSTIKVEAVMVQPTDRRFTSAAAANCYYNYIGPGLIQDYKRTYLSDLHPSRCKYTPFNTPPLIFANFFVLEPNFYCNFAAEYEIGPVRGRKRRHQTGSFCAEMTLKHNSYFHTNRHK